jgi:hypothetical protein
MTHSCNPSYSGGSDQEGSVSRQPRQNLRLSQKYQHTKKGGAVVQVVEHLPSKCEWGPKFKPKRNVITRCLHNSIGQLDPGCCFEWIPNFNLKNKLLIYLSMYCSGSLKLFKFYFWLLLYWGCIVTFAKVLTIYHSWIHPSIILLYPPLQTYLFEQHCSM